MVVAAAAVGQTMPIECGAKGNTACVAAPASKIMVVNMVFTSVYFRLLRVLGVCVPVIMLTNKAGGGCPRFLLNDFGNLLVMQGQRTKALLAKHTCST